MSQFIMENMYNVNSSKFQCAICYQDNGITDDPNDYSEYMGTPAQPAVLGEGLQKWKQRQLYPHTVPVLKNPGQTI